MLHRSEIEVRGRVTRKLSSTSQGWFSTVQLVVFNTISQRARDFPFAVLMQAVPPNRTSPPAYLQVQSFAPAEAGVIAEMHSAMAKTNRMSRSSRPLRVHVNSWKLCSC
jgi:hypothetical protein